MTRRKRKKHTEPLPISSLEVYKNNGDLVMPPVQRDLVWTKSQKQLLIDSIIKNYDIPKLYFRELDDEDQLEVIDGQQRLNAIFEFMNDEWALPADADPYEEEQTAERTWSELSTKFQVEFKSRALDVVMLSGYTDEERDETFLRLQNGTPLKAPEKRRAISGNMRYVVEELASHPVFEYCCFSDQHFSYQDVVAKALKMIMEGGSAAVTAQSLAKMYENNKHIKETDKAPSMLKKSLSFLHSAFEASNNPRLKKYAIVDLAVISSSLLQSYDLNNYKKQFGEAYNDFCKERVLDSEKDDEERDPNLIEYANCARGDSLAYVEFRQGYLRRFLLEKMPYLKPKDNKRTFSEDQKAVIYRLSGGKCQECGCDITDSDFEADHKIPWSKGGATQISNGQALCSTCNKKKGDKV